MPRVNPKPLGYKESPYNDARNKASLKERKNVFIVALVEKRSLPSVIYFHSTLKSPIYIYNF